MMAEYNEEQFKTTLMGGYDKEDVQNQFRMLKDTAQAEKNRLNSTIEELNKTIEEKDAKIKEKNDEIEKLHKDISEKYQSYIDNYDTIGKIVYETRIDSERILKEAEEKKDKMLADADASAKEKTAKAQAEVDKILSDGKRRYEVLQEEINELITLVNQVQHKFMKSFKAIHEISNTMAEDSFGGLDMDDSFDEEDGE
jgi:chromosome segregation ATPase